MRILFVAMPDSIHTARWIAQIQDQGWEIFLFPVYIAPPHPAMQKITLFGSTLPRKGSRKNHVRLVWWTIPFFWTDRIFSRLKGKKTKHFTQLALAAIIRWLQPDIVHSLEIQHAAYITQPVMEKERRRGKKTPKWIVTNWGSDVYLFGRLAEHRQRVRQVLEQCDFYSCECERDVILAQDLGLRGQVLPVFPNTGGFDLQHTMSLRQPGPTSQRRTILLKGYQNWAGRALAGLQALSRCADLIKDHGYRLAIYVAGYDVQVAAELFQQDTGIPVEIISECSHDDMLTFYGKARLYIGLSISDAISTSLLEAMVMGTFPIQSCTACASEWIEDGKTGFIVPPENIDIIERSIRRALQEDELVDQAAEQNIRVARERLDQVVIRPRLAAFYEQVMKSALVRNK